MADLKQRLNQDRAMRDAAKTIVETDVALLKNGVAEKGVGSRLAGLAGDSARTMTDGARDYADDHRLQVSGTMAAAGLGLLAWLFRDRIVDALARILPEPVAPEPEPRNPLARMKNRLKNFRDGAM